MYTEEEIEEISADQEETSWSISPERLETNNRSFLVMARGGLCPGCRKRLESEGKQDSLDDILGAIRRCCCNGPDYITGELPIMESAFRLFLANGNQALDLIELGRQLSERRGVDTYRTSVEMLFRLLANDEYYGFMPVGA